MGVVVKALEFLCCIGISEDQLRSRKQVGQEVMLVGVKLQ